MKKQYLEVGKVVATHGVKGMVRIQYWTDSAEFLCNFNKLYTKDDGSEFLKVKRITPHKNVVLAEFYDITDIEEAEKYRNKVLYVNRDDVDLDEGRYFISDLIGLSVFDTDSKKPLGIITDVFSTGANDVWQITNGGKDYLVPAIDEVIASVDIDDEKALIKPMKGIFDDED